MSGYIYWILVGFVLLIAEMTLGTFYLLVLGVAAFMGALAAWLGAPAGIQAAVVGAVAIAGVLLVWKLRAGDVGVVSTNSLDIGERVTLDCWVDQSAGVARVRYRNALWDARVTSPEGETGEVFYIRNVTGSVLEVSSAGPG